MNTTSTTLTLSTLQSASAIACMKFQLSFGISCDADDLTQDLFLKLYSSKTKTSGLPFGVFVGFALRILIDQHLRSAHETRKSGIDPYLADSLVEDCNEVPERDWDENAKEAFRKLSPRSQAAIKRLYNRYKDTHYNKPYIHEFFATL